MKVLSFVRTLFSGSSPAQPQTLKKPHVPGFTPLKEAKLPPLPVARKFPLPISMDNAPALEFPYTTTRFRGKSPEEDRATKELLLKEVGIDNVRPIGFQVLMKLYVRDSMVGSLELPPEYTNQDQYNTRIGMILDYGDDAFRDRNRFPNGRWCSPGEWMLFSRYENSIFGVNGTFLSLITDDKLLCVVDDPHKMNTSQLVGK